MKTHKIKLLLNFCDDVLSGDNPLQMSFETPEYLK